MRAAVRRSDSGRRPHLFSTTLLWEIIQLVCTLVCDGRDRIDARTRDTICVRVYLFSRRHRVIAGSRGVGWSGVGGRFAGDSARATDACVIVWTGRQSMPWCDARRRQCLD